MAASGVVVPGVAVVPVAAPGVAGAVTAGPRPNGLPRNHNQGNRPIPPPPAAGHTWPAIETFDIGNIGGWEVAMKKFFGEGGVFDAIYQPVGR